MSKNRDQYGRYSLAPNLTNWRTINFWQDYVPYYEQHTRDETIKYFNISEMTHKSMCKYYGYKKSWLKIHKTEENENNIDDLSKINFEEFSSFYAVNSREDTCKYFHISVMQLKQLCKKHKYKKPKENIAKNISKSLWNSGYSSMKIKLSKIDFLNEYLPYYCTHSREETCKHFNISVTAHKKFVKMFDFHKPTELSIKLAKRKIFYDNIYFDSYPEVATYIWAKDHNKNIVFEPTYFIYFYKETAYKYFPDFEFDGKLVEIKGDHFFKADGTMCNPFDHSQDEKYEAKHQCMIKNNIEIWTLKDYKKYIDYCIATYGENWILNINKKK